MLSLLKKKKDQYFDWKNKVDNKAKTAVKNTVLSIGSGIRSADSNVRDYFKPTENVRARDVIREAPKATANVLGEGLARFGVSAIEAPKAIATGRATGKYYNTPFGRINSFQSEAQNRVKRGDPLWKAIGNPALDTVLAGTEVGGVVKPLLRGAREITNLLPKNAVTKEVGAVADDLLSPLATKRKVPGKKDIIPAHVREKGFLEKDARSWEGRLPKGMQWMGGEKEKIVSYAPSELDAKPRLGRAYGQMEPKQVIQRTPDTTVTDFWKPKSKTFQSLQYPGLSIKDVSGGVPSKGGVPMPKLTPKPVPTETVPQTVSRMDSPRNPLDLEKQNIGRGLKKVKGEIYTTPNTRPNQLNQEVSSYKNTVPLLPSPRQASETAPLSNISNVEKLIYGNEAGFTQKGNKEGMGILGGVLRKGEAMVDEGVSRLLSSNNVALRTVGNSLRAFGGAFGKSDALQRQGAKYKGGIDYGQKLAQDLRGILPDDPKSLERIHSNLDPDLYGGKVAKLTPKEAEGAEALRVVSDYINDTNYKNGFISEELWLSNRGGKYITRAYEPYDMPPEVADFVRQSNAKFDLNPFKQRKEIDDWKMENAIKDPGYLAGKRLQQTEFNNSVKQMFDWLQDKPAYVSEVPKGGFVQVSDHKAYGDLAGKFVRKDVMEMVKGLYFEHKVLQNAYDVLSWYDRLPWRRGLKQTKTLYNPAVRIGNNVGNYVFAWLGGINPVTFTKNQINASSALKKNDPLALQLLKDGILGTGTHRGDIVQMAQELSKGQKPNVISKIKKAVEDSYGFVDDRGKYAGVKTFLDRGYSYEEATRRAMRMFQNYQTVGFLYDIGAKLPVFGNAFVRFQGSLASILKSAAVDHPLRLVGTGLALKYLGDMASVMSGETPEDKEIREERLGTPRVPFTGISLEFQTPWGPVNAARMLGVYANTPVGGASAGSDLAKMGPLNIDVTDPARSVGSDVLVGPIISTAIDKDFRGKSVADPESSKWVKSTLTPGEKWANRLGYLQRSYTPPFINDLTNVYDASQGKEDFYGKERTVKQALLRLGGIKTEPFGPEEAQAQRVKNAQFDQYARDDAKKQINAVSKELALGNIDQQTAQKRIQNIQSDIPVLSSLTPNTAVASSSAIPTANAQEGENKFTDKIIPNPNGGFSYIDENGDMKTVKNRKFAETYFEKADFEQSGESFRDLGDKVAYYKTDTNGDRKPVIEEKFRYQTKLSQARMDIALKAKDFQTWTKNAEEKYQSLQKIIEDPEMAEIDRLAFEEQMQKLISDMAKYQSYGGAFTKPKAAPKPKALTEVERNPYKGIYSFDKTLERPQFRVPRRVGISPTKSFGARNYRTRISRIRRKI